MGRCRWQRLGYTSLDANERSGHDARELKTVQLDAAAGLLRLQLQRCHVNARNPGNQVKPTRDVVMPIQTLCGPCEIARSVAASEAWTTPRH